MVPMRTPRRRALSALPHNLTEDIAHAGYYPALVSDVVASTLCEEPVASHLVHAETMLDNESVHRHITVLALTATRLIIVHADDHSGGELEEQPTELIVAPAGDSVATATSEAVPLSAVRGVMLTHVVANPETYQPGTLGREITVTVGWGTVSRIDLLPAMCADPTCEADHGFEGSITGDDISLRISADADGERVLAQAMDFAESLSAALGH